MSAVSIVLIALGGTFLFLFVKISCCRQYCWCPDLGGLGSLQEIHSMKQLEYHLHTLSVQVNFELKSSVKTATMKSIISQLKTELGPMMQLVKPMAEFY
ncbi:unnamed protein product, partial [Mesorhabditis belari]|uniref:Uncharacterized protein n=1 Tax=Mesorhabditis belari TaxID=2138241 RepID=A0AAF3FDV2_9BILA